MDSNRKAAIIVGALILIAYGVLGSFLLARALIDRRYPLSEVAEALQYLEEGHHQGKVVITV